MTSLDRRGLLGLLPASLLAAPVAAAWAADKPPTSPRNERLHKLFNARWESLMKAYPEWATSLGDHRYGDRLSDASPEAIAANDAATRRTLAAAKTFDRNKHSPQDRASLGVFLFELEDDVRFQPYIGYRSLSLGALDGFQSGFASLLQDSPVDTAAQARQILARMAAYPRRVEQEIVRLREGMALGWVPPSQVLERVLPQIDDQLGIALEKSPFFEPFTRLASDIPAAEQAVLREQARQAIGSHVLPALRRLRSFVAEEYLRKAAADGAFASYPGGAEVYAAVVKSETTTQLDARQVHEIGLRQMARLRGEIDAVMREAKFEGSFAQFITFLNTDPKFFLSGPEALLAGYRDIAKRIDPELPSLFAELPRAPYGVRAMPEHFSKDRAEYYDGPALDGTRPGWFNANAKAWRERPTWGMETLVAHEAVPGHHLQTARAVELGDLPKFRRAAGFTAYDEGWAVYAETLGFEVGLYKDPYSRFGHLQWQAFRAGRLVADTGIHAFGWTRQRAIAYMVENTGEDRDLVASEIDRYYSGPGQALGYMIGLLKIVELRDRARARLGERFDIRRFHMVILDQGSVPLPALELAVDGWIAMRAAEKA